MFVLVLSLIVFSNVVSGNAAANVEVEVHRFRRSEGLNDVDYIRNTKLHYAAEGGVLDTVAKILSQGPDLTIKNVMGRIALDLAVTGQHLDVVKALLVAGSPRNSFDNQGSTALHHAAYRQSIDIVIALIDAGADMTMKNYNGYNPLDVAVLNSSLRLVKILLAKRSPVNSVDVVGNVALHHAAYFGQLGVVLELLCNGANKNLKNYKGETPRDIALARGHNELVDVL